jgi:hypothetical protein
MEDLAPQRPWQTAVRWWAGLMAMLFVAVGLTPAGGGSWGPALDLGLGGAALVVALVPLPYWLRALALLLVAGVAGAGSLGGNGPAHAAAAAVGSWAIVHLAASLGVPAALFFRGRYRAYAGARYVLGAGLILALPFVGYCVVTLMGGELTSQVAAGVALGALALSLLGFMGADTTAAADYIAGAVILAICGQLGTESVLRLLAGGRQNDTVWALLSVSAFGATAMVGALAACQLLALRHWKTARKVDVHQAARKRPRLPSLTDSWSTKN